MPFVSCDICINTGVGCMALMLSGQSLHGDQHNVDQRMNPAPFANSPFVTANGKTNLAPLAGVRSRLFGPGFPRLDFSIFKDFRTTEKTHLQFRIKIFNLANTLSSLLPWALQVRQLLSTLQTRYISKVQTSVRSLQRVALLTARGLYSSH